MQGRTRRRFLQVSLAGLIAGFAGCGMPDGDGEEEGGEDGGESGENGGGEDGESGEDDDRSAPALGPDE